MNPDRIKSTYIISPSQALNQSSPAHFARSESLNRHLPPPQPLPTVRPSAPGRGAAAAAGDLVGRLARGV